MSFLEIFLHIDKHLHTIVSQYGTWTYFILFLIVFCETGLVVTPFLPGDWLLFIAGSLAAAGSLKLVPLLIIFNIAAITGNAVNYWIGYSIGPGMLSKKSRFLKQEYLDRTHQFYERYGGRTIIIARFVPIIRTFAPFMAGVGQMTPWRFTYYNILGSISWVMIFILGGYYFSNLPLIKNNLSIVVIFITLFSVAPIAMDLLKRRKETARLKKQAAVPTAARPDRDEG
ncbi:MAG: DedA family protein [bacterium]|nr:DedA family protein [bacterium]MDD3805101.1 DedA family protein [bacterium]MDD4153190.1 DedA family protein [bacterium]MDD4557882.1 DedA family protein [bacterium]